MGQNIEINTSYLRKESNCVQIELMHGKSHRFEYRWCKATSTPSMVQKMNLLKIGKTDDDENYVFI